MSIIGKILRVSTFGQSHSSAVGCVLEGFPPNFTLNVCHIQQELDRRRPGQSSITTTRNQKDRLEIISGLQKQTTLGSPICMLVRNGDYKVGDYDKFREVPRPGHADFTYRSKYGVQAQSGGGRSSARETVGRVLAGAVCKQYLSRMGIQCASWVYEAGGVCLGEVTNDRLIKQTLKAGQVDQLGTVFEYNNGFRCQRQFFDLEGQSSQSQPDLLKETHITRCPDQLTALKILKAIKDAKIRQDSIGGVIQGCIYNLPIGLGRPVFDKFPAVLSQAMLSIPATKGFEYGSGFSAAKLTGSAHNDLFVWDSDRKSLELKSNNSGGTLGGITTGQTFHFKLAFKPVSTIGIAQKTSSYSGEAVDLEGHGRHDPCVLPRAPPIVDSMSAIVVLDQILNYRAYKL